MLTMVMVMVMTMIPMLILTARKDMKLIIMLMAKSMLTVVSVTIFQLMLGTKVLIPI